MVCNANLFDKSGNQEVFDGHHRSLGYLYILENYLRSHGRDGDHEVFDINGRFLGYLDEFDFLNRNILGGRADDGPPNTGARHKLFGIF